MAKYGEGENWRGAYDRWKMTDPNEPDQYEEVFTCEWPYCDSETPESQPYCEGHRQCMECKSFMFEGAHKSSYATCKECGDAPLCSEECYDTHRKGLCIFE